MNWIKNKKFIRFDKGKAVYLVDVEVDSSGDLPEADAYAGCLLAKGSVAHDINTGDHYCLNSSGIWKKQKTSSELGTATSAIIMGVKTAEPIFDDLEIQEVE